MRLAPVYDFRNCMLRFSRRTGNLWRRLAAFFCAAELRKAKAQADDVAVVLAAAAETAEGVALSPQRNPIKRRASTALSSMLQVRSSRSDVKKKTKVVEGAGSGRLLARMYLASLRKKKEQSLEELTSSTARLTQEMMHANAITFSEMSSRFFTQIEHMAQRIEGRLEAVESNTTTAISNAGEIGAVSSSPDTGALRSIASALEARAFAEEAASRVEPPPRPREFGLAPQLDRTPMMYLPHVPLSDKKHDTGSHAFI